MTYTLKILGMEGLDDALKIRQAMLDLPAEEVTVDLAQKLVDVTCELALEEVANTLEKMGYGVLPEDEMEKTIAQKTTDNLRILSIEAIEKANSGHPGLPLGAAPIMTALYRDHMRFAPQYPNLVNRDRFVMSAGHGSALVYAALHLFGYDVTIDDIKNFRQVESKTPGHPEWGVTPGVEISTGPLGQGIANAVGMALASKMMGARFNKADINLYDQHIFALTGDGCLQEGISYEACSLAGHLNLDNLTLLYDRNEITIEGSTELAFTEDIAARFEAQGFEVYRVEDGNDCDLISAAIDEAKNDGAPSIVIIETKIGAFSPKEGSAGVHGSPLKKAEIEETKKNLGVDYPTDFYVDPAVAAERDVFIAKGEVLKAEWDAKLARYKEDYPEDYEAFLNFDKLPESVISEDFMASLKATATRSAGGNALNELAKNMPNLVGGSADLAPSNKTDLKNAGYITEDDFTGRNIHFGIREHAMAAIANGMQVFGGLRVFVSTFMAFSDYAKPALRVAALMGLPVLHIYTHDSLWVGEDGPTHQPIEQTANLRLIPNVAVFRPADSRETAYAYEYAMENVTGPTVMALSRQDLPLLDNSGIGTKKGGYVVKDGSDMILMASGSEVDLVVKAAEELEKGGLSVRVVSMPSFEVFEKQTAEYKESVLPAAIEKRVAVECATGALWYRYTGLKGAVLSVERFGESGPGEQVAARYGFTVENIVSLAKSL